MIYNHIDGLQHFGYPETGAGKVIYLFHSAIDEKAITELTSSIYTDTTKDKRGNDVKDLREFGWGFFSKILKNYVYDGITKEEVIAEIPGDASDEEKFALFLQKDILKDQAPLIFFDGRTKTFSRISSKKQLREILATKSEPWTLALRGYDHYMEQYEILGIKNHFGYICDGQGKVVYLFNGQVNTGTIEYLIDQIYTEKYQTEDGDEVRDCAEYDPSIFESKMAGEIGDEMSQKEIVARIPGDLSDQEKFILFLQNDVIDNNMLLIFVDSIEITISRVKTSKQLREIVERYPQEFNIYVRIYDRNDEE